MQESQEKLSYETMSKRFKRFFNDLKTNDRIGIFAHGNCTDGMISALFTGEILKRKGMKPIFIKFLKLKKDLFSEINKEVKDHSINKTLLLDINADTIDIKSFDEFGKVNKFLFVDHHPRNVLLKDSERIIKAESPDCTSWLVYELGKDLFKRDKWTWLACAAMVSEFSYEKKENLDFLKKQYPDLTKEKIMKSKPGINSMKVGALIIYYGNDPHKVYSLLERKDLSQMEKISKEVAGEVGKYVKIFKKEAEYYPKEKTYIYYYSPKFDVASTITTVLSVKDPDKIFVSLCNADENRIKCSLRHQAGKYDLNKISNECVKDLENGSGGGHRKASGLTFMKKDIVKFKENLLKAIRNFKETG